MGRNKREAWMGRVIVGGVLMIGCNGDDSGDSTATAGTSETATTTEGTTASTDASATASTATATATASGSASASATMGTTDPGTTDPSTTDPGTTSPGTSTTETTGVSQTSEPTTDPTTDGTTDATTGGGCGICNQPNQLCIDDVCVTTCQGQDPDPCGPDQVCDVMSGECKDPDATCKLAGAYTACGPSMCGPGTVCDGVDSCVKVAPCSEVLCTDDKVCWGGACSCTRNVQCEEPSAMLLNGPFSTEIGGLDFADDCNAWMVTLRSGPDYLRRLTPEGDLTIWTGVANLNMGEVRVLRRLTVPQLTAPPGFITPGADPDPEPIEGFGEVAITYTCCPTCGCQANPPQGVARLDEENMQSPLPIIIVAKATQGSGPFGSTAADAGPQGLTWGENRVLYVGNSTNNGDLNTADLDKMTQEMLLSFDERITAGAPVSPVHIVIATIGGDIQRYNTLTAQLDFVVDLQADVTSLAHDPFDGWVYAGLSTLEIVRFHPFSGDVETFDTMPGKGRVAVSPSGKLWYTPVKYISNLPLSSYPLPVSF